MKAVTVNLTPDLAEFVAREVSSGDYASASELIRDALRLLRRDRDGEAQKMGMVRQKIDLGLALARRGEFSNQSVMDLADAILAEVDG